MSGLAGAIDGDAVRLLVALLVLVAVGLAVYAALLAVERWRSPALRMLAPYSWDPESAEPIPQQLVLAETTLVRRIVHVAAGFADRVRLLPHVAATLEDAAVPLRASEALFFALAAAVLLAFFTFAASGSVLAATVMLALAVAFPPVSLRILINRRRQVFQRQLPDVLRMLAGALRSGLSLQQALQSVAQEVEEPVGTELRRATAQVRLGQSIETALAEAGQRMKNPDWDIAVGAIGIQREMGGNLAELLNRVADTMVARQRLRMDVKTLTAEGRISAIALGILPIAMGIFMYLMNREYVSILFEDSLGRSLLAGSGLLALVGFFWIKKTVTIKLG
jgi:tight adherence protein B